MKKKGIIITIIAIFTLIIGSLSLTLNFNKVKSEANDSWSNYSVVKKADGSVYGVGLNDATEHTLTLNIPSSKPFITADYVKNTLGDSETEFTAAWALVSFDFDETFELSEYDTLLIQLDRRMTSSNTGPRLFVEATDGTIYGVNSGSVRNDVYVKNDGSTTTWKNESGVRYTFQSKMSGTLNIPLSKLIKRVTGTNENGSSTEICRFLYGMDTSGSFKWYGDRATGFGTFAVADTKVADDVRVKKLLSVQDLTYSVDPEDENADINLANMKLGKKVYAKHTITGSWALDATPNYVDVINGVWVAERAPYILNIKAVATDGATLKKSFQVTKLEDNKYGYEVTPEAIEGYTYVSASAELTGTIDSETEIVLTYKPTNPSVTVKYVNEKGEEIKKATTTLTTKNEGEKYDYTITPEVIDGYRYLSSSQSLTGEITEDTVVTLKYEAKYYVSYKNGEFAGIYLTASTSNTFAFSMPVSDSEHPYLTADTLEDLEYKPQWAMITFLFDETFSLNDFDTLLIQIDRSMTNQNTGPSLLLESTNGTIYSINAKSNHNDVLVRDNGAYGSFNDASGGFRYTFQNSMNGTLNIPLDRIVKRIQGTADTGDDVTIKKLYYAMDTSGTYKWWGNRPTGFGTIACASTKGNEVVVKELLDVKNITSTDDAEDTTHGINLANLKNGTKVFTEHTIYSNWVLDGCPTYIDKVNSQWVVSRVPNKVTVNCVDSNGNLIFKGYSNLTKEDETYKYNVVAPTLEGYNYVSSDKELSGTADSEFAITLTYSQEPSVLVSYVDENGNNIAGLNYPSVIIATKDPETSKYTYSLTTPEFTGYYFVEATGELSGEITENKTVEFKYHSLPTVKVRCFDEFGERIAIVFLYATKSETGFTYNITAPKLEGRVYRTSNKPLTGEYSEGLEIDITYSSTFITINFVDEEGKELAEKEVLFPTVNPEDSTKFDYVVTPVEVNGYHVLSSSMPLEGQITENTTITVTYRKLPKVNVEFVDENNKELRTTAEFTTTYNSETSKYEYSIDTNLYSIFGYQFKESEGSLNGSVEFGGDVTTIKLIYKTSDSLYNDFEVITQLDEEDNPEFAGIWLKKSYAGGLNINVNNFDGSLGYGLTTVEFGRGISPEDSTGLLVQIARTDESVGGLQLRMYLEDTEGNLYRLFTRTNDRAGTITSTVIITKDGDYDEVNNEDVNWRHWVTAGQNGTMYIPWSVISDVFTNTAIPAGTIFTKLHFGRETRYNTTVNKPLALCTIAAVKVNDDLSAQVEIIRDLTTLNYTVDEADTNADVNLADMTKGKVVYMTRWLNGTHYEQNNDLDKVLALFDFSRVAPTVTVKYVDESGVSIRTPGMAETQYGLNGSTYTVEIPNIPGYEFVSSSQELTGTVMYDTEIVLTLRLVTYNITLKFVDESGKVIKEQQVVQGKFGEYVELELPTIEGYTYKEASSGTKFTITSDKEITLTYTDNSKQEEPGNTTQTPGGTETPTETGKTKKGCKSSIASLVAMFPVIAAGVVYISIKKRKEF